MGLQEGGLDLRKYDQHEDKEQRQNANVHSAGEATPQYAFRGFGQFFGHQETDQQNNAHYGQRWAVGLCGDGGYGCGDGRNHALSLFFSRGEKIASRWQLTNINTILDWAQSVNGPFELAKTLQIRVGGG